MSRRDKAGPPRGLARSDFRKLGASGFGDPLNAYPHSMAWFRDSLYVGTTRSNLCMLKVSKLHSRLEQWPVECPESLYDQDMRAQIWRCDPAQGAWAETMRSPMITGRSGETLPRELGYRNMAVFQAEGDPAPLLYACTYAPARGLGTRILRSVDGETFEPIPTPEDFGDQVITLRLLVPFKGRIFTSPTGRAKGNPNQPAVPMIYATRDPLRQPWTAVCEPHLGDPRNLGVFEMIEFDGHLYAGTSCLDGYQVWRTDGAGSPPYRWERVIERGAHRGPTNQGVASFCVFKGALYVGSGIQHGGIDLANRVGPAGSELIRINRDGSWDLIVGEPRTTPGGAKEPLSGFKPGFNNFFCGYFWRMAVHDDWLYLGTFDWATMLYFASQEHWPAAFRRVVARVGIERVLEVMGGCALYRSYDGVNWIPVSTNGFGNPYNYGIRTFQSTPKGLAVGFVNPFAPRVARREGAEWRYQDNPNGGLEVWLGTHAASTGAS